jgi:hypothetical protein
MANLIERKSLKLLAQAGQTLNQIIGEGLCVEPQQKAMRVMLAELRAMLDEFEDAYFKAMVDNSQMPTDQGEL